MKQYWKSFLRWFRSKWDYVEGEVEEVLEQAEPALEAIMRAGGKAFLDAALDAVKAAAVTGLPNEEKFIMAKKQVQRSFRTEAKGILESTVNFAIEMVYSRYKNETK